MVSVQLESKNINGVQTIDAEQFDDKNSKSEVYVSFDGKNKSHNSISLQHQISDNIESIDDLRALEGKDNRHNRNDSTHKIISILDNIKNNQLNRTSFYDSYIPKDQENDINVNGNQQVVPLDHKSNESSARQSGCFEEIFRIDQSVEDDFTMKQTPELGQKSNEPEHIKIVMDQLKQRQQEQYLANQANQLERDSDQENECEDSENSDLQKKINNMKKNSNPQMVGENVQKYDISDDMLMDPQYNFENQTNTTKIAEEILHHRHHTMNEDYERQTGIPAKSCINRQSKSMIEKDMNKSYKENQQQFTHSPNSNIIKENRPSHSTPTNVALKIGHYHVNNNSSISGSDLRKDNQKFLNSQGVVNSEVINNIHIQAQSITMSKQGLGSPNLNSNIQPSQSLTHKHGSPLINGSIASNKNNISNGISNSNQTNNSGGVFQMIPMEYNMNDSSQSKQNQMISNSRHVDSIATNEYMDENNQNHRAGSPGTQVNRNSKQIRVTQDVE